MTKLHRILAAVDFSEPARAAYARALALGRAHGAEVMVVHAVPADRAYKWEGPERAVLMASLRREAHRAGVGVKISIQQGDPAGIILLHAEARGADLIVVGTNERSTFDRFRFGSVAETVALKATAPVLVVPAGDRQADPAAAPFTNVLVAVDLSDSSRAAIERALAMADGNSRVTVLHVVPGLARAGAHRYMYHLMEPEYHRLVARDARRAIATLIPDAAKASRQVHVRVVTGEPSAEISRVAAESEADVILVGVKPRGAIGRRLFKSTAAKVMRTAEVPILAVAA